MDTEFKEGDRVQIVERTMTAEDAKSNLYYTHFAGIRGTITKVFSNQEASIEVDLDSLPEVIAKRHTDFQDKWRTDWLDRQSEEARNRLTPAERAFNVRYCLLLSVKDLLAAPDVARTTEAELTAAEQAELDRRRA